MSCTNNLLKSASIIRKAFQPIPALALVLGSGFQGVSSGIQEARELNFARLPGFPPVRVGGHSGRIVAGFLEGIPVLAMCGRAHFYEGHAMSEITFPIRVLAELGVRHLLLTNAAGGINRRLRVGDFMCLTDHVNFMGVNPLRGSTGNPGNPFVDLTQIYDPDLCKALLQAGRRCKVRVHRGVYLAVSGPSYETPAEIRAFGRLGADAVGMSTVPEAVVARQCGLRVAGLSCITNLAAGRSKAPLSHEEVLSVGRNVHEQAGALIRTFVQLHEKWSGPTPLHR